MLLRPVLTATTARRIPLPGGADLGRVLTALAEDRHPVALSGAWLEAPGAAPPRPVGPGARSPAGTGARTILSSEPLALATAEDDPFARLDDLPEVVENPEGAVAGGGWIGWLGYGLGARLEPGVLRAPPPSGIEAPAFWLAFYDHLVIHQAGRWCFEMLETPARAEALGAELERWRRRLAEPSDGGRPSGRSTAPGPELAPVGAGAAGHVAAVAACRERLAAGDIYQANLCLGLAGAFHGDPLTLLARALEDTAPRFAAAVGGVVSLSPERFLRQTGPLVWCEPMKGTRPRSDADPDAPAAAAARAELEGSAKDAAEHVMIVDLVRNDLGRVCEYGSISAAPRRTEPHPGVWQLVSTVRGRLTPTVNRAELLAATFPPGSVTGAPKLAAMQVISELESTRREAYTGAVGIAGPIAGLDLAVAIRTFELTPGRIWLGRRWGRGRFRARGGAGGGAGQGRRDARRGGRPRHCAAVRTARRRGALRTVRRRGAGPALRQRHRPEARSRPSGAERRPETGSRRGCLRDAVDPGWPSAVPHRAPPTSRGIRPGSVRPQPGA